ncbi:MAG: phage tail protein [Xenococcaceae cyanobacterium]
MKRQEIERLLPEVFQRTILPGTPLWAILEAMEAMHTPVEASLEQLDTYFNPHRTPEDFLPFLARWLNLEWLFERSGVTNSPFLSTGTEPLRELIALAAELSQWRGTAKGLILFLETATATSGFEIKEQVINPEGQIIPFHLQILAPAATQPHQALLERIIESEKPAYVTYELQFRKS